MTRSSSEFPTKPVQVVHLDCGSSFDVYAIEWPPRIVICGNCHRGLRLVGHDKTTGRFAYRHIFT